MSEEIDFKKESKKNSLLNEPLLEHEITDDENKIPKIEKPSKRQSIKKESIPKQDAFSHEDISFLKIFTMADKWDYLLMFLGTAASVGSGVMQPLSNIFFGNMTDDLTDGNNLMHVARKF